MTPPVRPEGQDRIARNIQAMRDQGADEKDIEAYLTEHEGLKPEAPAQPLIPPMTHAQSKGAPAAPHYYGGGEAKAGIPHEAIDAISFGFGTKAMAGMDALADAGKAAVTGHSLTDVAEGRTGGFRKTLGDAYNKNIEARQGALKQYETKHPYFAAGTALASAAVPLIATLGASAPETGASLATKAPLLGRMAKGAVSGAGIGAVNAVGHAHGGLDEYEERIKRDALVGAGVGSAGTAVMAGAGAAANKLHLGEGVSKLSGAVADRLPDGKVGRGLRRLSESMGTKGKAREELGQRVAMDEGSGFQPSDTPKGVPMIALDKAGPNAEALAEGIATRPGEGRSTIVNTIKGRLGKQAESLKNAAKEGTGVSTGGVQATEGQIAELKAQGDKAFTAARKATAGQGIKSASFDAVKETPMGKAAYQWALSRKANRMEALPQVEHPPEIPMDLRSGGVTPERWQEMLAKMETRGMEVPKGEVETLPDPEVLHLMKRYLRAASKPGTDSKQSAEALDALSLVEKVRQELPEPWRKADRIYAEHAQLVDLSNRARNVFTTKLNPTATDARKAVQRSLPKLERDVKLGTPKEQKVAQGSAAGSLNDLLDTTSPNRAPGQTLARSPERLRQTRMAFPDDQSAESFQQVVSAWDRLHQQAARVTGNSRTAGRGAENAAVANAERGAFSELVHGNVGSAVKRLFQGSEMARDQTTRRRMDAEIAKILAGPEAKALENALRTYRLRRGASEAGGKLLPRLAASDATRR